MPCKVNVLYKDVVRLQVFMDKNIENSLLLDFYGALLTDKQQEIVRMYYECDSGLSEIAQEFNMSRQAVYDMVKKAEHTLLEYENKLKCVEKYFANRNNIISCLDLLKNSELNKNQIEEVVSNLEKLLQNQ